MGLGALNTVGWAEKPYYDKTNKVLHWAFNLKAENAEENTLNYRVILLGRKGILGMTAVSSMSQLPEVKKHIDEVLAIPKFSSGNSYKDFDPKIDNVAAWTIGGLVAGKILAKVGLFAILGKFLLASWKFILLGFAAVGAGIRKFFKRKGSNDPVDDQAVVPAIPDSDGTPANAEATGLAETEPGATETGAGISS